MWGKLNWPSTTVAAVGSCMCLAIMTCGTRILTDSMSSASAPASARSR